MQLWGAEGGSTGALLVKENIFQHRCHYFSPNYRACVGSPRATIQGYNFSMRLRYPRPPSQAGRLWSPPPSASPLPIWPSRLGTGPGVPQLLFLFERRALERKRERWKERQSLALLPSTPSGCLLKLQVPSTERVFPIVLPAYLHQ